MMSIYLRNLQFLCMAALFTFLLQGCAPVVTPTAESTRILFSSSYEINVQGNKVGYLTIDAVEDLASGLITFKTVEHLEIVRSGQMARTHHEIQTTEHPDSGLRQFSAQISDGDQLRRISGVVQDEMLRVTTGAGVNQKTESSVWEHGMRGPLALDWSLIEEPLKPGEHRSGRAFDPVTMSVTSFSITAEEYVLRQGSNLLRCQLLFTTEDLPVHATCWIHDGVVVSMQYDLMDLSMKLVPRKKATAEDFDTDFNLDEAVAISVDRPLNLSQAEQKYRLVFPISNPGNLDLNLLFPDSPYQRIERVEAAAVVLCTSDSAKWPTKEDSLVADYLRPSTLIQSTASEFTEVVDRLAQSDDDLTAAESLTQFVFNHVSDKGYGSGFDSALRTFEAREGDCTEHACLLAALCRARSIPTRIAVGLIYQQHRGVGKFWFHMWNECRIGKRWIAFDATRPGALSRQSTYIKLTDSSLSDSEAIDFTGSLLPLLHALRIQVLD